MAIYLRHKICNRFAFELKKMPVPGQPLLIADVIHKNILYPGDHVYCEACGQPVYVDNLQDKYIVQTQY